MQKTQFFGTILAVILELMTVRVDGEGWDKMSSCVNALNALVEGGIENDDDDQNEQG